MWASLKAQKTFLCSPASDGTRLYRQQLLPGGLRHLATLQGTTVVPGVVGSAVSQQRKPVCFYYLSEGWSEAKLRV